MLYYIHEGTNDDIYNAGSKAREDVEIICNEKGFKRLNINTLDYRNENIIKKFCGYKKNRRLWKDKIKDLKDNDTIIIQYPLNYNTDRLDKVIKKNNKKVTFVLLIHDLNSIRVSPDSLTKRALKRIIKDDKTIPLNSNFVISHNNKMTEALKDWNVDENKIVNLEIFDYLSKDLIATEKLDCRGPIIIAGNLSPVKAGFVNELHKIKNVKFNLYGSGYEDNGLNENAIYKGVFAPDDLISNLSGSYGLVWDGKSIDYCEGYYGNYMKYNNPHKVSMYLAAGIPVIIWRKAALAEFIEKNNLGFAIDNLGDIEEIQKNITEQEYRKKLECVNRISEKIRNGYYLNSALNLIIK